jgi:outer membrane receptor for ferrienterochelin and colicins
MLLLLPLLMSAVIRDSADTVHTQDVVVTGSRGRQTRAEAPVLVSTVDARTLTSIQASSLADGLSFQPGMRLELNCQNCGFTQIRLQGLPGPYTQILIDSRPIFSALNGVYGLEQIPASFIDRIEVVRGGGSSVHGAGAVAGTVNVITRRPEETRISGALTPSLIAGRTRDHSATFAGSYLDSSFTWSASAFGAYRVRDWYDHNEDGYSEISALENVSGGLRGLGYLPLGGILVVDAHWLHETRRGGEMTSRPPERSTIAEQLTHNLVGAAATYEWASADERWQWSAYLSGLLTDRDSYYGGIGEDSSQAERAALMFGVTTGSTAVAGLQTTHQTSLRSTPLRVVGGLEYRLDAAHDAMPGYRRTINQRVDMLSAFAQAQLDPGARWSGAVGLRADGLRIRGMYDYPGSDASGDSISIGTDMRYERIVLNPRLTIMHTPVEDLQLRATYGMGFRGPQAFDEDFHISTLQGTARIVRLDPALLPERSHSLSLSVESNVASLFVRRRVTVDAFATFLSNPFVVELQARQPEPSVIMAVKRNGSGAYVAGVNAEVQLARRQQYEVTVAATAQVAMYAASTIIIERLGDEPVSTTSLLRTPNVYGSVLFRWQPFEAWNVNTSAILTGPMLVANERTQVLHRTPWFADLGIVISRSIGLGHATLTLNAGVQNLLNSYQRDLEVGVSRDAAFVYGPMRPRSITIGIRVE